MTSEVTQAALEPCPFCGGKAERLTLPEDSFGNGGGDVITCSRCQASSHVEFGRKENLVDRWNTRLTAQSGEGRALPWLSKLLRFHETGGHEGDGSDHAMRNARTELDAIVSGEGRSGAGEDALDAERKAVLQNPRVNDAIQTALERGELTVTMDGYLAALNARQSGDDDEEKAYRIGKDEGYQDAMQEIDIATGGDGEFRFCLGGDTERHCPDAETMKARILDRFAARQSGEGEREEFRSLDEWDQRDETVLLLVDYTDGDHPFDDAVFAITIGHNNDHNVGDDEAEGWRFAGWCWSHDHYVEGKGKVVGWMPIPHHLAALRATDDAGGA
jgi:Lar family restriction alleviation protein